MISNFLKEVTKLVLVKRKDAGISQEQLARQLLVDTSFISNVESNRKHYNLDHINKLSKLFNCSPRELIPNDHIED